MADACWPRLASGMVEQIAVVSPDPEVLAWAEDLGAVPLYQAGGGLNSGLELGGAGRTI